MDNSAGVTVAVCCCPVYFCLSANYDGTNWLVLHHAELADHCSDVNYWSQNEQAESIRF